MAEMLGRLNLTSQESKPFVLEEEDEEYPGCPEWALVGKVLAPNTLHISTIKTVLKSAWGNPKDLEIRSVGSNRFMAEFARKADKDRVTDGAPWKISNHGVLLKEFDPSVRPCDVVFDRLTVWARIMMLPFGLMNDTRGKILASNIGDIVKMDVDKSGRAWGDFLRVRTSVKVQEPLLRCVSVFSQKRQVTDVYQVMYEKLPLFCFSCGIIGHSSLVCKNPGERDAEGLLPYHGSRLCVPEEKKRQFGSWSGQCSFSSNQPEPATGRSGSSKIPVHTKQGDEVPGDVISPKKPRKPRATRNQAATPSDAVAKRNNGKGVAGVQGGSGRVSGTKRKEF
jgi:hypothetical protein